MDNKWQKRFIEMAFMVASWSKDASTQVGAVITKGNRIISMGFNGYPQGVADNLDPREIKYLKTIHAEENAILHANQPLEDCSIFITHMPCPNCCAKIIQVGIKHIYTPVQDPDFLSRWEEKVKISTGMIEEVGIKVTYLDYVKTAINDKVCCNNCY